ncbi:MAG: NifU family protein [Myxococcota bacterium]
MRVTVIRDDAVQQALDDIRPALQADGGDVELVEVVGTTVRVRLTGACQGCPAADSTLLYVVQRAVQEREPEVRSVVAVAR